VRKLWDVNPGFGGPIRQNKLWFYVSALYSGSQLDVADMWFNKNANNPNAWTYEPDLSRPAFKDTHYYGGDARLTWQVSPRNKIGILDADQAGCTCVGVVSATVAPEADIRERYPIQRRQVLDWTSPVTNRLLLEAGIANHFGRSVRLPALDTSPQMITVNDRPRACATARGQLPQRTEPRVHMPLRRVVHHRRARLQGRPSRTVTASRGAGDERRRSAAHSIASTTACPI
jgi:hypothetical protein